MKKIYLHIGLHKTASTSLQESCAVNHGSLASQNIHYPVFSCYGTSYQSIHNHSIPLFSLFTASPQAYAVNIYWGVNDIKVVNNNYRKQMQEAFESPHDLLLSGEDIGLLNANELLSFLKWLGDTGRQIIPFACVRSPYAFHCSQVRQQVNDGVAMNYVGLCPQRERLKHLKNVFGDELHFIPFAEACRHSLGPVGYLLAFCGVNPTSFELKRIGGGLNNDIVRLQNLLNHHQPRIKNGRLNKRYISINPCKGSRFFLRPQELKELEDHLDFENEALKVLLGEGFGDLERKTNETYFSHAYPPLVYSLVAATALRLQGYLEPPINQISLSCVHRFLINEASENHLRQITDLDHNAVIGTSVELSTDPLDRFPMVINDLAHAFINRE